MTELTKAKYWLLSKAIDAGMSVWAIRRDQAGYHFPDYHGLDNEGLLLALQDLCEEGYIIVEHDTVEGEVAFTVDLLRLAIQGQQKLCYRLTEKGGKAWEEVSAPQWNRYVTSDWDENGEDVLFGGSDGALDEYVDLCVPDLVDAVEVSRKVIEPWEVTYWRTVPRGYERRFLIKGATGEHGSWYVSNIMNYYSVPKEFLPFDIPPPVEW